MYCFPDFTELSLCFLVVHWVSLRQSFWILYQENYRSPFLCFGYWEIVSLWWCHVSLIFHVSWILTLLCSHLKKALTSSILYWLALGVKFLPSALLEFWGSSQTFSVGALAPEFSFPLVAELLSLYAFSQSCKPRPGTESIPFSFPRVLLNAQVCVISPSPMYFDQLSVHAHYPFAKPCSCCHWARAQRSSHGVGDVCRWAV